MKRQFYRAKLQFRISQPTPVLVMINLGLSLLPAKISMCERFKGMARFVPYTQLVECEN